MGNLLLNVGNMSLYSNLLRKEYQGFQNQCKPLNLLQSTRPHYSLQAYHHKVSKKPNGMILLDGENSVGTLKEKWCLELCGFLHHQNALGNQDQMRIKGVFKHHGNSAVRVFSKLVGFSLKIKVEMLPFLEGLTKTTHISLVVLAWEQIQLLLSHGGLHVYEAFFFFFLDQKQRQIVY